MKEMLITTAKRKKRCVTSQVAVNAAVGRFNNYC